LQTWKVPQLGHVVRLEDLTLVGSSVTVESEGNTAVFFVFVSEGNTSAEGNLNRSIQIVITALFHSVVMKMP
jgi:hypothetical protein